MAVPPRRSGTIMRKISDYAALSMSDFEALSTIDKTHRLLVAKIQMSSDTELTKKNIHNPVPIQ